MPGKFTTVFWPNSRHLARTEVHRIRLCQLWKCALFVHTMSMRFEWSRAKAAANLLKHRVDFAEASNALDDDQALTTEDGDFEERRFKSLVMSPKGIVLVVIFTIVNRETTRLISARRASKTEKSRYFRGIRDGN